MVFFCGPKPLPHFLSRWLAHLTAYVLYADISDVAAKMSYVISVSFENIIPRRFSDMPRDP